MPLVRSVFDQYSHFENRLTHALVQVLMRDQRLANAFVTFATGIERPKRQRLSFACQLTPGDRSPPADEEALAERRGIPDAWIYDENAKWALVVESKVTVSIDRHQLQRHIGTARRRNFSDVSLLVITADEAWPARLPSRLEGDQTSVHWQSWERVHEFLCRREAYSNSVARFLGNEFVGYLRTAEARGMAGEKTLTRFTGVPFGVDVPYNDAEARVVLRSLMRGLRDQLASSRVLELAADHAQKPLTGTWDVLPLKFAGLDPFTRHPHLTVFIHGDETGIEVTLPNDAGEYWRRLCAASDERLVTALHEVAVRISSHRAPIERGLTEPRLVLEVVQRHFHARRLEVEDGKLRFDLDTLFARDKTGVRMVPAWLPALRLITSQHRRANMQLELLALFPFSEQSVSHGPDFIATAAAVAEAMEPFLRLLTGSREAGTH